MLLKWEVIELNDRIMLFSVYKLDINANSLRASISYYSADIKRLKKDRLCCSFDILFYIIAISRD